MTAVGLRSKIVGRRGSSIFLNKQNAQCFKMKPLMCAQVWSVILECLSSVKCDITVLKLIQGLIKIFWFMLNHRCCDYAEQSRNKQKTNLGSILQA